jgi:hypothetical protein
MTTQIWPSSDDFADGASAYGAGVRRYLRVRPGTGTGDITLLGGLTAVASFAPYGGDLKRYWIDTTVDQFGNTVPTPSPPGSVKYGAGFECYGAPNTVAGLDAIAASVERQTYIDDGEVTAAFRVWTPEPDTAWKVAHCTGVCGRIQGGTVTARPSGTDVVHGYAVTEADEYIDRPDGYYFLQYQTPTAIAPQLLLFRVSSGTWTRLAASLLSDFEQYQFGQMDGGIPRRMRMTIEGEGTGVRIRCFRTVHNPSGGFPTAPVELPIFSYWDPGTVAITTAGRWGCVGTANGYVPSITTSNGLVTMSSLRIRNAAGTTVHLRDLWHRTCPNEATQENASLMLVPSRSLSMAYTGDMLGEQNTVTRIGSPMYSSLSHWSHLKRDPGNNRIVLGQALTDAATPSYPSGNRYGWYLSQSAAGSTQQHQSLSMTFIATPLRETRRMGLHLRGSYPIAKKRVQGKAGNDTSQYITDRKKGGYQALVDFERVGGLTDTFTLKVIHYPITQFGASVLLATADLTPILSLDTEFKLGLEVRDIAFAGSNSDVSLKVRIDGVDIVLTLETITGISLVSGWLVDGRTEATRDGLTIGFYGNIYPSFLSTGLIYISSFAAEALTGDVGAPQDPLARDDGVPVGGGTGEIFVNPGGTVDIAVLQNDEAFSGATVDVASVTFDYQPRSDMTDLAHGSATVDALGTVTYTCPAGSTENGVYWEYRFLDSTPAQSNAATIRVTIVAPTPPTAVPDNSTAETGASSLSIPVLLNDQLASGASWAASNPVTIVTQSANGTAVADAAGLVVFTSDVGAPSGVSEIFHYTATDSNGLVSNTTTVDVVITPVGGVTPPFAQNDPATVLAAQSVDIPVLVNDTANTFAIDPATVVTSDSASGTTGTHVAYTSGPKVGQVLYTAVPSAVPFQDSFYYKVSDINGNESNTAVVTVFVTGTGGSTPPVAADDSASVVVGATVVFDILGNDTATPPAFIDPSSVVITQAPASGTASVDAVNGDATFVSGASDTPGQVIWKYTVDDTNGATSNQATVTMTVNSGGAGQLPDANQDNVAMVESDTVVIDVLDNDAAYNGASLDPSTVEIVTPPVTGSVVFVNAATGYITYTAAASQTDTFDSFTYRVSDDAAVPLTSAPGTVSINILGSNNSGISAPTAGDDHATVASGQTVTISILANDHAYGGALIDPNSVQLFTSSLNFGSAGYDAATGLASYSSLAGSPTGLEFFTYRVWDTGGLRAYPDALVTVTVTAGAPPDPSEQESVYVPPETATKSGTLTIPVSWPVNEDRIIGTLSHRFDTGHRQTLPYLPKERRMFSVQMLGATHAERAAMSAFFLSHRGAEIPFDWVHPLTQETITVRFSSTNTASKHISGVGVGAEDYRFDLIEVFDAGTYGA